MHKTRRFLLATVTAASFAAACGGDATPTPTGGADAPVTTVTIDAQTTGIDAPRHLDAPVSAVDGPVAPPVVVSILPTSYDFGSVVVGDLPQRTFAVSATGGPPGALLTVSVDGGPAFQLGGFSSCPGATLSDGQGCSVIVVFAPMTSGPFSGTLHVNDLEVALAGTGASSGDLHAGPAMHDFGSSDVNVASAINQTVTVTNSGDSATGALAVAATGSDASSFGVSADTCSGHSLAGMASCTFQVGFTPQASGDLSAQVAVSGVPGGTATIAVTGHGNTPGHLTGGGAHDFGPVTLHALVSFPFTIMNDGESATGVISLTSSGNTNEFMIQSTCPDVLQPANSCTVTVVFQPQVTDPVSVHVDVAEANGNSVAIDATGSGVQLVTLNITPTDGVTVHSDPDGIGCGDDCTADYSQGTHVTLDGQTESNATLVLGWTGTCEGIDACDSSAACDVTMSASCIATPILGAQLALLRTGFGLVASDPTGIFCGGVSIVMCNEDSAFFPVNSTVVLTASLTAGPGDPIWTGCEEASGDTCTVPNLPVGGATVTYDCCAVSK